MNFAELRARQDAEDELENLEEKVTQQQVALKRAQQDLADARERRERMDEFVKRSIAINPPGPQRAAPPPSASKSTAAEVAAFVLLAAAKRRGEVACDEIPLSDRIIDQRVDDPAATAAAILAAAAKARSKT